MDQKSTGMLLGSGKSEDHEAKHGLGIAGHVFHKHRETNEVRWPLLTPIIIALFLLSGCSESPEHFRKRIESASLEELLGESAYTLPSYVSGGKICFRARLASQHTLDVKVIDDPGGIYAPVEVGLITIDMARSDPNAERIGDRWVVLLNPSFVSSNLSRYSNLFKGPMVALPFGPAGDDWRGQLVAREFVKRLKEPVDVVNRRRRWIPADPVEAYILITQCAVVSLIVVCGLFVWSRPARRTAVAKWLDRHPADSYLTRFLKWRRLRSDGSVERLARKELWDELKWAVAQGAEVDAKDRFGYTALHRAASDGNEDVVRLLLDHGADVNAEYRCYVNDPRTATALNDAMVHDRVSVVRLLLERGGRCPGGGLPEAGGSASAELIEILLAHGAPIGSLHNVESKEVAEILIHHGADVNKRNEQNETPLHTIDSPEVVEFLLAHGADVHAKDSNDVTPLHRAPARKAGVLLGHGADVDAPTRGEGWTPLHLAAIWGSAKVTRVLLAHGANVGAKDGLGLTALHWAEGLDRDDVAMVLQNSGATVDRDFIERLKWRVKIEEDKLAPLPFLMTVHRERRETLIIARGAEMMGYGEKAIACANSMLDYFACYGDVYHRYSRWPDE